MRLFSNKWLIRAHDERAERELVASLGLRPLTARLLTARGLTEPAAVSSFIKKTDLRFYDPFLLTDMDKAVSRIEQAIRTGERICIYGDYDVDGVTSTTVLYTYLTSRGARCTYFIPDRLSEGYGLSRAGHRTACARRRPHHHRRYRHHRRGGDRVRRFARRGYDHHRPP